MNSDFDLYFDAGPLRPFARERRAGGRTGVRGVHVGAPAHRGVDPASSELVIGLMLRSRGRVVWQWDGARPNEARSRRAGTLGLTPPGATAFFDVAGDSEMLIIALPLRALGERLAPDCPVPTDFGMLHDRYTEQPAARQLCYRLWRALASDGPFAHLTVDALAEDLIVEFATAGSGDRTAPLAGRLSHRQLRRIREALDDADADVPALAAAAGLPVRTFRRWFAATLGATPHHWLMATRLRAAAEAITAGNDTLAGIAAEHGFASQSHLTTEFARVYGVTPARYRRSVIGSC